MQTLPKQKASTNAHFVALSELNLPHQFTRDVLAPAVAKASFHDPERRERHAHALAKVLRPGLGVRQSRLVSSRLIERFGSIGAVFKAPPALLITLDGIGPATLRHLHSILETAQMLGRESIPDDRPLLTEWSTIIEYCRLQGAFLNVEHFRVLFLDKKNRLIADEVQHTGTVDHCPVYPREVIKRALELSATALLLVHNHPSGDPAPSSGDVRKTKEIVDISKPLGIVVHDHIIIGSSGHTSLRALKLLAG